MVKQVISIEGLKKHPAPSKELAQIFKVLENIFSETKIYKID